MPNIGPFELIVVLVIILVIFGPKRLPGLGRQLGSGMREFKDSITGKSGDDADDDDTLGPQELSRAQQADPLDPEPDTTRTAVGERDKPATRRGA
jgi:sec-independent protein translocase protein TatA